ncbi:MAG TPA: metallophosphoesterase, partial [Acidimicrobiia bacterium]
LVGAGDIASCATTGDEATAALLDSIDGTVFTAGDNVYDTGTAAEFANCYNPSWGRHKSRTRPVTGNHDYATAGASGYYGYFGAAAGDPAKGYYSYNLGAWHVIVLNSTCSAVGGCGAGSPQDQWLRADLAASSAACTVAIWHHPLFSSGTVHGGDATYVNFWQALYENGADVVIAGHDHLYERFGLQTATGAADVDFGLRQFTVGTGGRSHYAAGTPVANSEVINSATFGVMKLTLHANSYDWEFVPEAGKTFTDTGTASCHGAPSVSPPPPPPPPPSSGPVTFRSASSNGSPDSRSSITIAKPTGTQAGDVMVCSIVLNDDDPSVSAPPGWTLVRQDGVLNAVMQAVFVRVAGAAEPSSYTWNIPDFRRIAGGISSYSGVDTAHPIDAHNGATDSVGSTSIIAPSITTTTAGAMLLHLAAINAEGTISPPPGSTERWESNAFRVDSPRDALAAFSDIVQADAGATGNRTAVASLPGKNVGVLVALRPAPSP